MVGFGMREVDQEKVQSESPSYLFKLVCLGDSDTGKSAAIARFTRGVFDHRYAATIGIDFAAKTVQMYSDLVKVQIWDTSGQERFRTILNSYYRGAHGIFVFFNLTDKNSFASVRNWKQSIDKNAAEDVSVILVGAKSDLEPRSVEDEDIAQLSRELDLEYFEISNKTGEGINRVFERMLDKLLRQKNEREEASSAASNLTATINVALSKRVKTSSKTCIIL